MYQTLTALIVAVQTVHVLGSPNTQCNTSLSTIDDKTVYVYGDIVHFQCVILDSVSKSTSVSIVNLQTNISTICIRTGNTCTADIQIGVLSWNIKERYSCRYDGCLQDTMLSVISIKIDRCSIPKQHDRPDIQCVVNDMSSLMCHWQTLQTDDESATWHAMYTTQILDQFICCVGKNYTTSTSDSCPVSDLSCLVPMNNFLFGLDYEFVLTRITHNNEEIYNYTVFAGFDIAKVDINDNVEVKPGSNPRDLTVQFIMQHSPASVQGMLCNLTYISQWNNLSMIIARIEQSTLDVNITINNLIPYTTYTVTVSCKPIKSQYWSNHVTGIGQTRPIAPEFVPHIVGYHTWLTSHSHLQIYLYIKPVALSKWYGKDFHYTVTLTTDDVSMKERIDGEKVTAILQLKQPMDKVMTLQIYSENEAGRSRTQETLSVIPNFETRPIVVVEYKTTGSYVTIYFTDIYNVTSVTYYRCQGQQDTYPPICQTDVEAETAVGFLNTHFWSNGEQNTSTLTWYYGVTLHQHTHTKVEDFDIIWSSCDFHDNRASRDTTLGVSANIDSKNTSVAIVTLHFQYCKLRRKPMKYLVGIWNDVTNVTKYCEQEETDYQSFNATPSTSELNVLVDDVNNIKLCVRVQYDNDYDTSDDVIPQQKFIHQQDVVSRFNSTNIAIAVTVSCIVCLLLTAFVIKVRRYGHRMIKDNTVSSIVIDNILSSAYEQAMVDHKVQQNYTVLTDPDNSSGYESLEVTTSEANHQVDANTFTDMESIDNVGHNETAGQNSSTDHSSNSFPLIYSKICHNNELPHDHDVPTIDNINTNPVSNSGESNAGSSDTDINCRVNYAKLQTNLTSDISDNSVDLGENFIIDHDDNTIQRCGLGENNTGSFNTRTSYRVNYAKLQTDSTSEIDNDSSELSEVSIHKDENTNPHCDSGDSDHGSFNTETRYRVNYAKIQTDLTSELNNDNLEFNETSIDKGVVIDDRETDNAAFDTCDNFAVLNYARLESMDEGEADEIVSELNAVKETCINDAINVTYHDNVDTDNIVKTHKSNLVVYTSVQDTKSLSSCLTHQQERDQDTIDVGDVVDYDVDGKDDNNNSEENANTNGNNQTNDDNDGDNDNGNNDDNGDDDDDNNEFIDSYSLGVTENERPSGYVMAHLNTSFDF